MSVQKEDTTNSITYPYQSDITEFNIPFLVKSKDSIKVYLGNTLLPSSGYTYRDSSVANIYGVITLTNEGKAAYDEAEAAIKISREVPITQLENFSSQASYGSASERGLDKLTLIAQDADLRIEGIENKINTWSYDKAVRIGIDEQIISGEPNLVLPKDRQRKILAFDDKGSVAPKSLGGGLEINTETVDIKLNGETLSKNSYGIRGNYRGGNGVTITENTISAKSGSSTIVVDPEGIKGNYRGGNGVTVTENTISAKSGNSTIVVDPEGIKGNYDAGDGINISANQISAKVDNKGIFIDEVGRISSDAVRKQDISTGLKFTDTGKLETVVQGIDEESINYTFDGKIMCGHQSGEVNLDLDCSTLSSELGKSFFVLDENQQLYVFLRSSDVIVRRYNPNDKSWTDLASIAKTASYTLRTPIFKIDGSNPSRLTFMIVEYADTTNADGTAIYRNKCRLIEFKDVEGSFKCIELSNYTYDVEKNFYIYTSSPPYVNEYVLDFYNINLGNVCGSSGRYAVLANARVDPQWTSSGIMTVYLYHQIHVIKVEDDYSLTHSMENEKLIPHYNFYVNTTYESRDYCRYVWSDSRLYLYIRRNGDNIWAYHNVFNPDTGTFSGYVQYASGFSYENGYLPTTVSHEGNSYIFYSHSTSALGGTKATTLNYHCLDTLLRVTSGSLVVQGVAERPKAIAIVDGRLGVCNSNMLTIFEYNIEQTQFVQKYSLPIPGSRTFYCFGNVDNNFGHFSYYSNNYSFSLSLYSIINTYYTFMPSDREKFDTIEEGAEVNVQSDWNVTDSASDAFIKNKPVLATVATSGNYNDLSNKLTAGENITIDNNNVISSIGGGESLTYGYGLVKYNGSLFSLPMYSGNTLLNPTIYFYTVPRIDFSSSYQNVGDGMVTGEVAGVCIGGQSNYPFIHLSGSTVTCLGKGYSSPTTFPMCSDNGDTLFAPYSSYVYYSTDRGQNWRSVYTGVSLPTNISSSSTNTGFAIKVNNEIILCGGSGKVARVYQSNGTWTCSYYSVSGFTSYTLRHITWTGSEYLIVTSNGYMLRSGAIGTTWTSVLVSNSADLNWIAYDRTNGRYICASTSGILYYSTNGTTWTSVSMFSECSIHGLYVSSGTFYLTCDGKDRDGSVYYSTNMSTWTLIDSADRSTLYGFYSPVANPDKVYYSSYYGKYGYYSETTRTGVVDAKTYSYIGAAFNLELNKVNQLYNFNGALLNAIYTKSGSSLTLNDLMTVPISLTDTTRFDYLDGYYIFYDSSATSDSWIIKIYNPDYGFNGSVSALKTVSTVTCFNILSVSETITFAVGYENGVVDINTAALDNTISKTSVSVSNYSIIKILVINGTNYYLDSNGGIYRNTELIVRYSTPITTWFYDTDGILWCGCNNGRILKFPSIVTSGDYIEVSQFTSSSITDLYKYQYFCVVCTAGTIYVSLDDYKTYNSTQSQSISKILVKSGMEFVGQNGSNQFVFGSYALRI